MSASLHLSPVPEVVSEEESRLSERFADALEEIPGDDVKEDKKDEPNKRDSKIEDGFAGVLFGLPDVSKEHDDSNSKRDSVLDANDGPRFDSPKSRPTSLPDQQSQKAESEDGKSETPSTTVLALLVLGVTLAVLLVSLDRTIITTVINSARHSRAAPLLINCFLGNSCNHQ